MDDSATTRREFARTLAAVAAVPLAAPTCVSAADEPPAPAAVDALIQIVRGRYGMHLNDEQLQRVRQRLLLSAGGAARLRAFALTSGDEPDFAFSADVP